MIPNRFDAIARSVNAIRTRRSLIGLLAGGLLGLTNLQQGDDASLALARKKRKKRRKQRKAKACPKARRCGKRCCRGKTRCQRGVCRKPKPAPKPVQKPPQPSGPPVRKNVHSLTAAELNAFARGVAVMKARDASDPTSWTAQVNLHRDFAQHGNYHFLPWHRMFLYHFEQILRDAANDQSLTVPYWNPNQYSASSTILPAIFRDSTSSLYQAGRNRDVNAGISPTYTWMFDTFAAMNALPFDAFGGRPSARGLLEGTPHNDVHVWVDGVMSQIQTSPQDPVFWLHHANVDRLWEAWLRQPGRANPTSNAAFMDQPFQFFDKHGQAVTMTAREVLDVVRQLNYRYDDQPVDGNPAAGRVTASAQSAMSAARAEPASLVIATAPGRNLGSQRATVPVAVKQGAVARFRTVKQAKGPVRLTLKGVGTTSVTGILYEVHVGKIKPNPNPKHTSYVGSINPFTVEVASHGGHGNHGDHGGSADFTFDITRAVASGGGVKRVTVTLVPIWLSTLTSPPAGPWLTVEQFVVEVNAGSAGAGTTGKKRKPARKKAQGPKATQLPKRRQQQNAAKRRRLTNKRRQQQRRQQPAASNRPSASHTGDGGEAVNVPGAKHSSFFDLPGTGSDAATEGEHAHH